MKLQPMHGTDNVKPAGCYCVTIRTSTQCDTGNQMQNFVIALKKTFELMHLGRATQCREPEVCRHYRLFWKKVHVNIDVLQQLIKESCHLEMQDLIIHCCRPFSLSENATYDDNLIRLYVLQQSFHTRPRDCEERLESEIRFTVYIHLLIS